MKKIQTAEEFAKNNHPMKTEFVIGQTYIISNNGLTAKLIEFSVSGNNSFLEFPNGSNVVIPITKLKRLNRIK